MVCYNHFILNSLFTKFQTTKNTNS